MQLARVAQQMVGVAMVLFTLSEYHSPPLTGLVTFMSMFPGIVVSPIAGALLDRHGRLRLIRLDYLIALGTMVLIGGLAMAHLLSPPLLIVIATISSLTAPFSQTGLRSLFPLMVPEHLWERVNALDSNGYLVASILGPPIAAGMVGLFGGQVAITAIGIPFALAAITLVGVREPRSESSTTGSFRRDVLDGIRYAWNNRTIRGLAASISTLNVAGGIVTIVLPLLVLERLHGSELVVGLAFAVSGLAGVISVFLAARMDTRNREWGMLVYTLAFAGPAYGLLLFANTDSAAAMPVIGFAVIGLSMLCLGLLNGPSDIALFTIRQRRTDPAWMGRAFAISMAVNGAGFPIGAAIGGALATTSLDLSIVVAVAACVAAAILVAVLVPKRDEDGRASDDATEPKTRLDAGVSG
jgi:MFS family permease